MGTLDLKISVKFARMKKRHNGQICIVEGIADLWALERSNNFKGQYHVLGGVLSAIDVLALKSLVLRN